MREALEAPRALGVDTRTSLELFKRDVRPRGSRGDSWSRKHSTPTSQLPAKQAETRSRTTSASGGNDRYAIGKCLSFSTAMEDDSTHGGGSPRRRSDGGALRNQRYTTRGFARTCMRVLTFAGALVGTARAGTSRIRCCLGRSAPGSFARASHSIGEVSRLEVAGRSRVSTDVACDRHDRALRARTPFASPRPSSRDRPIDDDDSRANNSFSLLLFPFPRVSSLSSRSQALSWRKAWRARAW